MPAILKGEIVEKIMSILQSHVSETGRRPSTAPKGPEKGLIERRASKTWVVVKGPPEKKGV